MNSSPPGDEFSFRGGAQQFLDAPWRISYTTGVFMGAGLERKYYVFALRAMWDITATIVVPVAVVLVCKYLLHIEGALFYVLLMLAFIGTALVLWRKMKTYGEAFDNLSAGDGSARR